MNKQHSDKLYFELAQQAERLARYAESGEAAVARWISSGVPAELAAEIAQKTINEKGFIDSDLFTRCIEDRLRVADAVNEFLNQRHQAQLETCE